MNCCESSTPACCKVDSVSATGEAAYAGSARGHMSASANALATSGRAPNARAALGRRTLRASRILSSLAWRRSLRVGRSGWCVGWVSLLIDGALLLLHLLSPTPSGRQKDKRRRAENDDSDARHYERNTDAACRLIDLRHGARHRALLWRRRDGWALPGCGGGTRNPRGFRFRGRCRRHRSVNRERVFTANRMTVAGDHAPANRDYAWGRDRLHCLGHLRVSDHGRRQRDVRSGGVDDFHHDGAGGVENFAAVCHRYFGRDRCDDLIRCWRGRNHGVVSTSRRRTGQDKCCG